MKLELYATARGGARKLSLGQTRSDCYDLGILVKTLDQNITGIVDALDAGIQGSAINNAILAKDTVIQARIFSRGKALPELAKMGDLAVDLRSLLERKAPEGQVTRAINVAFAQVSIVRRALKAVCGSQRGGSRR